MKNCNFGISPKSKATRLRQDCDGRWSLFTMMRKAEHQRPWSAHPQREQCSIWRIWDHHGSPEADLHDYALGKEGGHSLFFPACPSCEGKDSGFLGWPYWTTCWCRNAKVLTRRRRSLSSCLPANKCGSALKDDGLVRRMKFFVCRSLGCRGSSTRLSTGQCPSVKGLLKFLSWRKEDVQRFSNKSWKYSEASKQRFQKLHHCAQVKAWPSSNGAAWETKSYKAHARLPTVYGQWLVTWGPWDGSGQIFLFPWPCPIAGWFVRKNPAKMDDLGVPLFQETSIWIHIAILSLLDSSLMI